MNITKSLIKTAYNGQGRERFIANYVFYANVSFIAIRMLLIISEHEAQILSARLHSSTFASLLLSQKHKICKFIFRYGQ